MTQAPASLDQMLAAWNDKDPTKARGHNERSKSWTPCSSLSIRRTQQT